MGMKIFSVRRSDLKRLPLAVKNLAYRDPDRDTGHTPNARHTRLRGHSVHGVRVPFSTPLPTLLLYHMKGLSARSEKFSLVMKITNFFLKIFSFLGKKFSQNFHKILLDKIRRVWYNEIFGRGIRPRPTQKVKYFFSAHQEALSWCLVLLNFCLLLLNFRPQVRVCHFPGNKKDPFGSSAYALEKYAFLFSTFLTRELSSTNCFTIAETL